MAKKNKVRKGFGYWALSIGSAAAIIGFTMFPGAGESVKEKVDTVAPGLVDAFVDTETVEVQASTSVQPKEVVVDNTRTNDEMIQRAYKLAEDFNNDPLNADTFYFVQEIASMEIIGDSVLENKQRELFNEWKEVQLEAIHSIDVYTTTDIEEYLEQANNNIDFARDLFNEIY